MDPPNLVGGSNLLQIFIPQPETKKVKRSHGKKQKLKGFSAKARYQLAKNLSMVVWPVEPAHASLTYGDQWPEDPKEHLDALRKWCDRNGFFGVWRLEFQDRNKWRPFRRKYIRLNKTVEEFDGDRQAECDKRNAVLLPLWVPHYHALLCGFSEEDEAKLARYWSKLSGNSSEYGSKVTYRESGKASWYLALHASKGNQAPDIEVGRWWGWINGPRVKENMLRSDLGYMTDKQVNRAARIARKLSQGRLRATNRQSFSIFMNQHNQDRLVAYLNTL
ncbi:hypothetical protein [Cerasicoccus fimbriatus]|uniref:hypothetical protein n=1 Tax=Cerasicoccus fimbriatus TaxID=3014554 RepID=UPI0022B51BF2|nr:hypothetical protein [Cerasicoccus sp. TK19100]